MVLDLKKAGNIEWDVSPPICSMLCVISMWTAGVHLKTKTLRAYLGRMGHKLSLPHQRRLFTPRVSSKSDDLLRIFGTACRQAAPAAPGKGFNRRGPRGPPSKAVGPVEGRAMGFRSVKFSHLSKHINQQEEER